MQTTTSALLHASVSNNNDIDIPIEHTQVLCVICNTEPSKYTCPRCSLKTCSVTCSTSHKSTTGCTGIRDKVSFIPMNQYSWGSMMDDYVYLEEVSRKVSEVGRDIVAQRYMTQRGRGGRGLPANMRAGRMQGRGTGVRGGVGESKRDYLSLQLGFRDIDMDVLPTGMERHRINQSTWEAKNQTALMTIEFIFHPSIHVLPSQDSTCFTLLSHRNRLDTTPCQLIQGHVKENSKIKKNSVLSEWLSSLVALDDHDAIPPLCVIKATDSEPQTTSTDGSLDALRRPRYHKLDWNKKLMDSLRYKHFVEFPTIEVMEEDTFKGILIDDEGIRLESTEERRPKRRKLDPIIGEKTIKNLIGGYGSESEEDVPNSLTMLNGYSDTEQTLANTLENEPRNDDGDILGQLEVDEDDDDTREVSTRLLKTMTVKQLQALVTEHADYGEALDEEDMEEQKADEAKLAELLATIKQRNQPTV